MSGDSVCVGARVEMRGPYGQPWRPATIVWMGGQMPGDRLRVVTAEADDGARRTVCWPHPDLRAPADRVLLVGCPTPRVCSPAETRCMADAERAEVCDPSGQWVLVADCNVVGQQSGGRWVCQETDEGHACLPLEAPQ